jgi:hypothetical protein
MANTLKVTFCDDGSVKVDARGMKGTAAEITRELQALAEAVGGELVIEKHVSGAHTHTHGDGEEHTHS